jgi:hypothetical protein
MSVEDDISAGWHTGIGVSRKYSAYPQLKLGVIDYVELRFMGNAYSVEYMRFAFMMRRSARVAVPSSARRLHSINPYIYNAVSVAHE